MEKQRILWLSWNRSKGTKNMATAHNLTMESHNSLCEAPVAEQECSARTRGACDRRGQMAPCSSVTGQPQGPEEKTKQTICFWRGSQGPSVYHICPAHQLAQQVPTQGLCHSDKPELAIWVSCPTPLPTPAGSSYTEWPLAMSQETRWLARHFWGCWWFCEHSFNWHFN